MIFEMQRRQLLRLSGTALAAASTAGVVSGRNGNGKGNSDDDGSEMRDLPNENVPHVSTGALPSSRSELPTGHWIINDGGWVDDQAEAAKAFAEWSRNVVTIDDEEFVLDSLDDWEFREREDYPDMKREYGVMWSHALPPKPSGESYTVSWEFEWTTEPTGEYALPLDLEDQFPFSNEVTIVHQNGD